MVTTPDCDPDFLSRGLDQFVGQVDLWNILPIVQFLCLPNAELSRNSRSPVSVTYERDAETRTITIGTATCAGDALAKAFISLCTRELGEAAFTVAEVDDGEDEWMAPEGAGVA